MPLAAGEPNNLLYGSNFCGSGTKILPNGTNVFAINNTQNRTVGFRICGPVEWFNSDGILRAGSATSATSRVDVQETSIKDLFLAAGWAADAIPGVSFFVAEFESTTGNWFARVSRSGLTSAAATITVGAWIRVISNPTGGPVFFDNQAVPVSMVNGSWHYYSALKTNFGALLTWPYGGAGTIVRIAWPFVARGDWRHWVPKVPVLNEEEC